VHVHRALGRASLVVPIVALALLTATYGGLISFAPRILEPTGVGSAATFFLIYGGARAITRWFGGRASDRFGARRVALVGLFGALAGVGILATSIAPVAVVASALAYGGGCGMAQSATFVGMLAHSSPGEVRLVGTLWNLAFDGGVSLGGALLGIVASNGGERAVLTALPLLTLLALLLLSFAWTTAGRRLAST
jgi:predicted MFS family arabinose efflux permease